MISRECPCGCDTNGLTHSLAEERIQQIKAHSKKLGFSDGILWMKERHLREIIKMVIKETRV